ncbi:hypothetical protein R1flu_004026 [Riccia fluitans]|uniref:Uncharacterized protein n=1 Tax=Riccia fluitans TaxID=41844 RepID=A0ABD1YS54_9MARC
MARVLHRQQSLPVVLITEIGGFIKQRWTERFLDMSSEGDIAQQYFLRFDRDLMSAIRLLILCVECLVLRVLYQDWLERTQTAVDSILLGRAFRILASPGCKTICTELMAQSARKNRDRLFVVVLKQF